MNTAIIKPPAIIKRDFRILYKQDAALDLIVNFLDDKQETESSCPTIISCNHEGITHLDAAEIGIENCIGTYEDEIVLEEEVNNVTTKGTVSILNEHLAGKNYITITGIVDGESLILLKGTLFYQ